MRSPLVILAALFSSSVAAAEPPAQYIAVGGLAGIGVETVQAAWTAEGGVHLGESVWAHGLVAYGGAGDDQGTGVYRAVRGGVEAQRCTGGGGACAVVGADLGYQHVTWVASGEYMVPPHEIHDDVVVIAHLMLDAGGQHVRVRTGVELGPVVAGYDNVPLRSTGDFDLTLAVAYRW